METHPVTRSFKIGKAADVSSAVKIREGLGSHDGVLMIAVSPSRKKVTVEYDLHRIQFPAIEKALAEMGLELSSNWLHSLQHNWLRFSEENELANLKHKPHCCNKSPR